MRRWRSILIAGSVLAVLGMGFMELVRASEAEELRHQIAAAEHRQDQLAVIASEVARYESDKQRLESRLYVAKSLEAEQWQIVGGPPALAEEEVALEGDFDSALPAQPSAEAWQGLAAALLDEPGLRRLDLGSGGFTATYAGTAERLDRLGHSLVGEGRVRSFVTAQGGRAASLHAVLEPGPFREREP